MDKSSHEVHSLASFSFKIAICCIAMHGSGDQPSFPSAAPLEPFNPLPLAPLAPLPPLLDPLALLATLALPALPIAGSGGLSAFGTGNVRIFLSSSSSVLYVVPRVQNA